MAEPASTVPTDPAKRLSAVQTLRSSVPYRGLIELLDRRAREPNIFRLVTGLTRSEGVHSTLLAWLLDPQQWHGLGDSFAREFLGLCLHLDIELRVWKGLST